MTLTERIERGELRIEITSLVCKLDDVLGVVKVKNDDRDELLRLARIGEQVEPLLKAASELLEDQCDQCSKYIAQHCTSEPVKCDVITTRKAIDALLPLPPGGAG